MGPFGVGGGGLVDGGDRLDEEVVPAETGVAFTAVRVEDPQGRPPPRRAVSIAGDQRLGPLADDVASEADPRPPRELEAQAARLGDRGREAAGEPGRIEDQEQGLRPAGERGEPAETVGHPGRSIGLRQPAAGQVEDEQVDRAAGQQAAGDRETLVQAGRGDDDEPLEADPARDRLDRVEAAREVQPGDHRALRLRFGDDAQRERGPAAGAVAADRDARRPRQAPRSEDRIEAREPGRDDPVVRAGLVAWLLVGDRCDRRRGRQGQGPHDPRSLRHPIGPGGPRQRRPHLHERSSSDR